MRPSLLSIFLTLALSFPTAIMSIAPYSRSSIWDTILPFEDHFRILEQTPLSIPSKSTTDVPLTLARADWKETPTTHLISLDIPGVRREDIKIEVDDGRVLRVSGERRQEEAESEKWHRAERATGKFWRQFRLPSGADMEGIGARLENGVLRITVPKVQSEGKRQPRIVEIMEVGGTGGEDIKFSSKVEN